MHTNSLERIVPDHIQETGTTGHQTLALHLERYQFAATQITGRRILDIACGVGYGTHLLFHASPECQLALGVDTDEEAISYAKSRYQKPGIEFETNNAMTFTSPEPFDSIVTLETIEHLPDPQGFIEHLTTLLRPGGRLVTSVPITPTVDANPFHLHDFTERSFKQLVHQFPLQELEAYRQHQSFNPLTVLTRSESRLADLRPNLLAYYVEHPSAFIQRLWSTLRYGFCLKYLTLTFKYRP